MIRYYSLFPSRRAFRLAALGCLLLVPAGLRAQTRMSPADTRRMQEHEMQEREYALYHAGEAHSQEQMPARNVLPQIREDFKQLQLVNNGLMQQVVSAKTLDYKLIAQSIGEIKNRAGRLRENLLLPQLEEHEGGAPKPKAQEVAPEGTQLKAALFELDRLIMSFVTNPNFKSNPNTVAFAQAGQARRDLLDIIELSRAIKKTAQQLGK